MNPGLDATQIDVGFAEIDLRTPRWMNQRDKYFLLPQPLLGYVFPHNGVAAGVSMLITQALEDAYCRVALFL